MRMYLFWAWGAAIRGGKTSGSFTINGRNGNAGTAPPKPNPECAKPLYTKIARPADTGAEEAGHGC